MTDLFTTITGALNTLSKDIETLKDEIRLKEKELVELRDRVIKQRVLLDKEYWIWQPEHNHLESLTCPILITPKVLSTLIEDARNPWSAFNN